MTNPILTITSEGVFDPNDCFVMQQGGQFDIHNDSRDEQTVEFSIAGASTHTVVVGANATVSDINVDFPATIAATSAPPTNEVGPGTGITIKQMSETGTKCGLGFVSGEVVHRIASNTGNTAIQVLTAPSANYTVEFRVHTCSDGTVAITSYDGSAYLTWSRELGTPTYPDVLKYSVDLQDTLFFKPCRNGNGQWELEPDAGDHSGKTLVHDGSQGLCLQTTTGPTQGLFFTPVAFPAT